MLNEKLVLQLHRGNLIMHGVIFPHGHFLTQFEEEHVDAAMSKSSHLTAVAYICLVQTSAIW
jgi:hypothetical protein